MAGGKYFRFFAFFPDKAAMAAMAGGQVFENTLKP
jgi:hypothetical protein